MKESQGEAQLWGEWVHKQFENRQRDGTPLPEELAEHEGYMKQLEALPGKHFCEQKMALNMLAGIALLVGVFTLLMLRRLATRKTDAVQAAWLKVCRRLEKAGLPRAPYEGALDYAARVGAARPELAAGIDDLAARGDVAVRQDERAVFRHDYLRTPLEPRIEPGKAPFRTI